MVTTAPANLLWLAREWEKAIPSAVFAGIVADKLHVAPSKHKSYNDNLAGSWPRAHTKDKQGPRTRSCAIDVRMSLADMKLVHSRYRAVYNDITDSRRRYIHAFNGWDGNGSPGRYNLVTMTVSVTDRSHEWHEHVDLFYLYVGDDAESWKAARANLSIVRGWSDQRWQMSEQKPEEDDDMDAAEVRRQVALGIYDVLWVAANERDYNGLAYDTPKSGHVVVGASVRTNLRQLVTRPVIDALVPIGEATGLDTEELAAIRAQLPSANEIARGVIAELGRTDTTSLVEVLVNGLTPDKLAELSEALATHVANPSET